MRSHHKGDSRIHEGGSTCPRCSYVCAGWNARYCPACHARLLLNERESRYLGIRSPWRYGEPVDRANR